MMIERLEVDLDALQRLPETDPVALTHAELRHCGHTCFITCVVTLLG
jgi:hypothetical protein